MEEADGSEQAENIRMLLPTANNRRYSTGALACYDGYFQSEREEAKLSRKALSAVPPLRSPHRHNYTSSHCASPSPPRLVCKHCHLLSDEENPTVTAAAAAGAPVPPPAGLPGSHGPALCVQKIWCSVFRDSSRQTKHS